jgi:hypothetical protein
VTRGDSGFELLAKEPELSLHDSKVLDYWSLHGSDPRQQKSISLVWGPWVSLRDVGYLICQAQHGFSLAERCVYFE